MHFAPASIDHGAIRKLYTGQSGRRQAGIAQFTIQSWSEPDCLEYLNFREQAASLSDRTPGVRIWSISAFRVYRTLLQSLRSAATQFRWKKEDRLLSKYVASPLECGGRGGI